MRQEWDSHPVDFWCFPTQRCCFQLHKRAPRCAFLEDKSIDRCHCLTAVQTTSRWTYCRPRRYCSTPSPFWWSSRFCVTSSSSIISWRYVRFFIPFTIISSCFYVSRTKFKRCLTHHCILITSGEVSIGRLAWPTVFSCIWWTTSSTRSNCYWWRVHRSNGTFWSFTSPCSILVRGVPVWTCSSETTSTGSSFLRSHASAIPDRSDRGFVEREVNNK